MIIHFRKGSGSHLLFKTQVGICPCLTLIMWTLRPIWFDICCYDVLFRKYKVYLHHTSHKAYSNKAKMRRCSEFKFYCSFHCFFFLRGGGGLNILTDDYLHCGSSEAFKIRGCMHWFYYQDFEIWWSQCGWLGMCDLQSDS